MCAGTHAHTSAVGLCLEVAWRWRQQPRSLQSPVDAHLSDPYPHMQELRQEVEASIAQQAEADQREAKETQDRLEKLLREQVEEKEQQLVQLKAQHAHGMRSLPDLYQIPT